eukprot:5865556-Prymnesium_polylepis.1
MMCARACPPCAMVWRAPECADRGVCWGRDSSARDARPGRRPAAAAASSSRSRRVAQQGAAGGGRAPTPLP